jgi:hypothetical protein
MSAISGLCPRGAPGTPLEAWGPEGQPNRAPAKWPDLTGYGGGGGVGTTLLLGGRFIVAPAPRHERAARGDVWGATTAIEPSDFVSLSRCMLFVLFYSRTSTGTCRRSRSGFPEGRRGCQRLANMPKANRTRRAMHCVALGRIARST